MSKRPLKRLSLIVIPKRSPNDAFQQIGDVILYNTGSAFLGTRVFAYGTAIDDFTFSEGFVARRRIDVPHVLLVDSPDGEETVLFFSEGDGVWCQVVALDDFRFDKVRAKCGPRAAAFWCDPGLGRRIFWRAFLVILPFMLVWGRELLSGFFFVGFLVWASQRPLPKRITLP